jgi:hypothetical protein
MKTDGYWKWDVKCFYSKDVAPPKQPGGLAIGVNLASDGMKDTEVEAGMRRKDIGLVIATSLSDGVVQRHEKPSVCASREP